MARVLLLGHKPPHVDTLGRIEAHNLRTGQFVDGLLAGGHAVTLCAYEAPHLAAGGETPPREGVDYHAIAFARRRGWVRRLQSLHDEAKPHAVVAVNFDAALAVTKLRTDRPVWMDFFGDPVTILQASRRRDGTNRGLSTGIAFVRDALRCGDVFSACSQPQADALLGQLGMAGRLNASTTNHDFVRVVRPSPPSDAPRVTEAGGRPFLLARGVPADARVVLWYGGFHPWADVDGLSRVAERVLTTDARAHLVVVGQGSHDTIDDPFATFMARVRDAGMADRVHALGWLSWADARRVAAESDIGLNVDGGHAEARLGTRTRLVELLSLGLPIVSTDGSELSALIATSGAGVAVPTGHAEALAEAVTGLLRNDTDRVTRSRAARTFAGSELSVAATTAPLLEWMEDPRRAPDSEPGAPPTRTLAFRARTLARRALWRIAGLERH